MILIRLPRSGGRPESGDLFDTFPPGGHDNTRVIPASVSRAIRLTSRPAFPHSGFCRASDILSIPASDISGGLCAICLPRAGGNHGQIH